MKNFFIPNSSNNHKPYLLRNSALLIYTLLLFLFNTYSGFLGISQVSASTITSLNIVNLTNDERETYGLEKLTVNSDLSAAALAKANNMFAKQYWDHFGPNGETPWQFIKEAGYKYVYAGENLAKGFKTAEGVVQAWMASPTHRENLLSGNYKEIGIAAVSGELLGENVVLVVQMFGNRTTDVSESVKPSVVEPGSEEGDIKSIDIIYPQDGEILNDAGLDIRGRASGVSGEYTIAVLEESEDLGEAQSEDPSWTFNKDSDWTEGEHVITAILSEDDEINDSVAFTIDSDPPEIKEGTLSIERQTGGWKVEVQVDGEPASVNLVSGENTILVTKDGDTYISEIEDAQLSARTVIIASDKLGNTAELDISQLFERPVSEGIMGTISGLVSGIDVRNTFNILFATFILALLGTEFYVYFKKGMLAKKANSMLTIGVWWLLLVVGIANGFRGTIG